MAVLLTTTLAALAAVTYAAWFTWDWRGSARARHALGREPWCDGGPSCSMKVRVVIGVDFGRLTDTIVAVAKIGDAFHVLGDASAKSARAAADFQTRMQKVAEAMARGR